MNYSNIFATAQQASQVAEKQQAENNIYETLIDIAKEFRMEMNLSQNRIRFIQYKQANQQLAMQLQAEVEALEQEYMELCSKESYKWEPARLLAYSLKKKKYALKCALDTEKYAGWYIKSKSKKFSEKEIQDLANTLYKPNSKQTLYSFLYRLWAPLVINWEYVQMNPEYIPDIELHCEEWVEDSQARGIWKHEKDIDKIEDNGVASNLEDDSYIDAMDAEYESI